MYKTINTTCDLCLAREVLLVASAAMRHLLSCIRQVERCTADMSVEDVRKKVHKTKTFQLLAGAIYVCLHFDGTSTVSGHSQHCGHAGVDHLHGPDPDIPATGTGVYVQVTVVSCFCNTLMLGSPWCYCSAEVSL